MVVLENKPERSLDQLMKKIDCRFEVIRVEDGYTREYMVNICQGKVAGVIL